MKKQTSWLAILAIIVLTMYPCVSYANPKFIESDIVIKLEEGYSIDDINNDFGTTIVQQLDHLDIYLLRIVSGDDPEIVSNQINQLSGIDFCHPNYLIDPLIPVQSSLPVSDISGGDEQYNTQPAYSNLNLSAAHLVSTGTGVKIAVIDGGIDLDHPSLSASVTSGYDFVDYDQIANDELGGSNSGHGTFVAGVIHLVAPNAEIVSYRATNLFGESNGYVVAEAILKAIEDSCRVINLSMVTVATHEAISEAISYAKENNVIVVAAAGNGRETLSRFPANDVNVLAVAALDSTNQLADFSNYGSHIDICAPGTNIYAPYKDGEFAWWGGTSFSAPFVSAQAALVISLNQSFTWQEVMDVIIETATSIDDINSNFDGDLGNGVIDFQSSLNAANGLCGDVTINGQINHGDLVAMVDYIYFDNEQSIYKPLADLDGWQNITSNDLQALVGYAFEFENYVSCDPTYQQPFPISNDILEINNLTVPVHNDTWEVELWLDVEDPFDALVFPFEYSSNTSAILDSVVCNMDTTDTRVYHTNIDQNLSNGYIAYHKWWESLPAGTYKVGTFYFSNTYSETETYISIDTTFISEKIPFLLSKEFGLNPSVPIFSTSGNVNLSRPLIGDMSSQTVSENSTLSFIVSATDDDSTFPILTSSSLPFGATFNDNGDGTGEFNWTPTSNQIGMYNITFNASDGLTSDDEIVLITVEGSGPPSLVISNLSAQVTDEGVAFDSVNLNDYVADINFTDQELTWSYTGNKISYLSFNENNILTIIITERTHDMYNRDMYNSDWYGSDTVTLRVTNPVGGFTEISLELIVNNINDAPTFDTYYMGDKTKYVGEQKYYFTFKYKAYDIDNDTEDLLFSVAKPKHFLEGYQPWDTQFHLSDNEIFYLNPPYEGWVGSDTIIFTVMDPDGLFDVDTVIYSYVENTFVPECGDFSDNGFIDALDFFGMINYLWDEGTPPVDLLNTSCDNVDGITNNDLTTLGEHFYNGEEKRCRETSEPSYPTSDDTIKFINVAVPAGNGTWATEVWTSTASNYQGLSIAFEYTCLTSDITLTTIDYLIEGQFGEYVLIDNESSKAVLGVCGIIEPIEGYVHIATLNFAIVNTIQPQVIDITLSDYPNSDHTTVLSRLIPQNGIRGYVPKLSTYDVNPYVDDWGNRCIGLMKGNLDCSSESKDAGVDISDLVLMVSFIFSDAEPPQCIGEGDIAPLESPDGEIDISDLVLIVDFIFGTLDKLPTCTSTNGKVAVNQLDPLGEIYTVFEDSVTSIILDIPIDIRGLQLEFNTDADNKIIQKSEVNQLDLIHGIKNKHLRVGLVDLDGADVLSAGKFEIIRLDGNHELSSAKFTDTDGKSYNLSLKNNSKLLVTEFSLAQNYPNPSNPSTIISYSLPSASDVVIDVFNINGQKITTLNDSRMDAGIHQVEWDGTNSSGNTVASGVYFYRIIAGSFTDTKKMVLLK